MITNNIHMSNDLLIIILFNTFKNMAKIEIFN